MANLEKGDLGLSEIIAYGYVVYGQTRTGKIATCLWLSGNTLKGQKRQISELRICMIFGGIYLI